MNKDIIRDIKRVIDLADFNKDITHLTLLNEETRRITAINNSCREVRWMEGGHYYYATYRTFVEGSTVFFVGIYNKDGKRTSLSTIKKSFKNLITINKED